MSADLLDGYLNPSKDRIYSDDERHEVMSAKHYCHEAGIWSGRFADAWRALTESERKDWRERTRAMVADFASMPRQWQEQANREAFTKTLAINDAEFARLSLPSPLTEKQAVESPELAASRVPAVVQESES